MLSRIGVVVLGVFLCLSVAGRAEDRVEQVRKVVERSTLDQPGTKPFHLKAVLRPSLARDMDSGRTGEVEIWWEAPTRWRREVSTPAFHQVEIVDGGRDWQKNEGNYFPEWLREISIALVKPVPDPSRLLEHVKTAEVKTFRGTTHFSWVEMGSDGGVSKGIGSGIDLQDDRSFFSSGLGWSADCSELSDFHGREIARKVTSGGIGAEVTARVTMLEDLQDTPAGFFDPAAGGGDAVLQTSVVDELVIRKTLVPQAVSAWPVLEQGPLEGVLMAEVVIDREGTVREIGSILSDNPGLNDAARERIGKMRFSPYLVNGVPVQVVTTVTMPFKTTRPAGMEHFESARTYFEHVRAAGFLAAGNSTPYVLRAEFETRGSSGDTESGRYEDTWLSDSQWRREAWFGKSHYVRTRNGDKRYELAEGSQASLLRLVFEVMEPVPALDTFIESDWRIKHDSIDGFNTIRVATGYESPDGKPDSVHFRGYWFYDTGQLVKTYVSAVETRRTEFTNFDGKTVARRVDVLSNGKLAMRVRVTELISAGAVDTKQFVIPKHDTRQFTGEVR
jgi:Gram-negative bacterial TonB protein C-terminal